MKYEAWSGFWRDTALPACLIASVDALVGVPVIVWTFRTRYWSTALLGIVIALMILIKQFGYAPKVALLALRARLAGKVVSRRRSMFNLFLDD